jgi:hypothetical protein
LDYSTEFLSEARSAYSAGAFSSKAIPLLRAAVRDCVMRGFARLASGGGNCGKRQFTVKRIYLKLQENLRPSICRSPERRALEEICGTADAQKK